MSEPTESRLSRLKSRAALPSEILLIYSFLKSILGQVSDFDTVHNHMNQILEIWYFLISPAGNSLIFVVGLIWLVFVVIKEPQPQQSSAERPSLSPTVPETVAPPKYELQYRPINGVESLEFMESAKLASTADAFFTPTPVKIVCSDKGRGVAEHLARALILLNFEVMVNHDNASHLFTAKPAQPVGITLRGQRGDRVLSMVKAGLSGANLNSNIVEFPKGPEYNYTQIEIGDPTTNSYWDRSGP
jgi:hypothetical protein